ncbi:MAG: hypothetical protein JW748_15825 [Anaerolineales bacterium]|nr:hypothetical protein [Anaerolineales bacterium]
MSVRFTIQSSDPALLEKAARIAKAFVQPYLRDDIVGIVFLGAVARGYFDRSADIDIAIFTRSGSNAAMPGKFQKVEDMGVQCWISDYETELAAPWDMAKRWTYARAQIVFDPGGRIARLLEEKVPLKPEERKWLLMSGLTLSEWCVNRLTQIWVERGNIISAHQMIDQGLVYFFDMLFGLNEELVADMKWRYYCVEQLERLPGEFRERIQDVMALHAFTLEELERRKAAFMGMWREMQPAVEKEAGLSFDEMLQVV